MPIEIGVELRDVEQEVGRVDLAPYVELESARDGGSVEPAAPHRGTIANDLAHAIGERASEPALRRGRETELLTAEPHRVRNASAHRVAQHALVPAVGHLPVGG